MLGLQNFAKKVFGTANDRELKSLRPLVSRVNELEPTFDKLSDDELRGKTAEFKQRIEKGESLDLIMPEAFAAVRAAGQRVLGMRHFDVQLVGGATLHRGRIAEMKTGEGKTLVATLPTYLNALEGKGVHVVTVNDYLAKRDSEWMGNIYKFLGLNVGVIVHGLSDRERKENYAADITYGTNNEFGFDYLRDNMKFDLEEYVQREHNFAIVDEVDSILIDEARTPLIISGPSEESTGLYHEIDRQIRTGGGLEAEKHYTIDEKSKTAALTEEGVAIMEERLKVDNLYDPQHIETLHHVNQALRAHTLFKNDVDYVVKEGQVIIIDEFTGRLMPGRRWSDGLHQAVEAKEGAEIENENQTLATITFQNYFRMYNKLAGMTGTADTEATEFKQIYNLDVTVMPTNKPMIRDDMKDMIFKSEEAKYEEILKEIQDAHDKGQPVLVGTISVEKSEKLAGLLKKAGIRHNVLNAKQHEREAEVVAQAGRKGSVTISTSMAGRGTDIVLGGNPEKLAEAEVGRVAKSASDAEKRDHEKTLKEAIEKWEAKCKTEKQEVLDLGGLYILVTERHESRRIDNQLRGRAGRQGDPGKSRFYLSLDDDLMRIFGGERIKRFMEDDLPIEHKWINRAIENAQKKVEGHNYDIRKHLLDYDNVNNDQRKVIYKWRKEVLARNDLKDMVVSMVEELADAIAADFFPNGKLPRKNGQAFLDRKELNDAVQVTFNIPSDIQEKDIHPFNDKGLKDLIFKMATDAYEEKERNLSEEIMRQVEKMVLLTTIDSLWKDHLLGMDHLREGIGLQGYGQKDPLLEFKKQGFKFFEMMMNQITGDVVRKVFAVQVEVDDAGGARIPLKHRSRQMEFNVDSDGELVSRGAPAPLPPQMQQGGGLPGGLMPGAPQGQPQGGGMMGGPMPAGMPQGMGGGMQGGMGGGMPMPQMPAAKPVVSGADKVGRNDPCPCGSGKKYKKCHGK